MRAFLVVALLAAACGSKSPATTTTPAGGEGPAAPLPDLPFGKLDHKQKAQFMKEKVMPALQPIFQAHDAKKYAEFTCETCHGKGAKEGHFDMPNAELPTLVVKELMSGGGKYKKDDLEWMGKQVKPTMAKLLGETEWSPENPKGFGCAECHHMEE